MRYSVLGVLLALLALAGCNGRQVSSDPLTQSLNEQLKVQDSLSQRMQVRQAALNHVKKYYPESTIQGVSIYSNAGSDYVVGVDTTSGDSRQTIQTNVELFVKDSGEKYWKTSFAPPPVGAKPLEFAIEVYKSPAD